jgi:histidine triad (HIT) family protein
MSYDPNNIFAKILRKELPCIPVYEDDSTLAFMDIMPQADGHTLVIPKEQAQDIHELSDKAAADLIVKVKLISAAVKQAMGADGITLFQLNGQSAGQTVPHIHFHVLPGSILSARSHASVSAEKSHLEAVAGKIKSQLDAS